MIWFVIFIATVVSIMIGLLTRSVRRALRCGLITLILGVVVVLVIIYSGLMGG